MKNLNYIIRKVLLETHDEQHSSRYMFFSNLEQMKKQCELLLDLDQNMIEEILEDGHDWAQDHISEAKNNIDQVFDFLMNETNSEHHENDMDDNIMMEGRKKKNVATNKKLWQQSLAWAKQRYEVCPSAYCNGAAVKRYNSKGGKWRKE
jgi:division protein CdvB (Snf7/Vps24/ESCRT-III family)